MTNPKRPLQVAQLSVKVVHCFEGVGIVLSDRGFLIRIRNGESGAEEGLDSIAGCGRTRFDVLVPKESRDELRLRGGL